MVNHWSAERLSSVLGECRLAAEDRIGVIDGGDHVAFGGEILGEIGEERAGAR